MEYLLMKEMTIKPIPMRISKKRIFPPLPFLELLFLRFGFM